jgi:hypothetical protein
VTLEPAERARLDAVSQWSEPPEYL